jgi:ribosomal protein S18 acetylase RimI-like enzyme
LATHPKAQRRGIASALIGDLTSKISEKNLEQLSVNTQSNNLRSLALYKKCGFHETGEEYPLYTYDIAGSTEDPEEKEAFEWDTVKMQS